MIRIQAESSGMFFPSDPSFLLGNDGMGSGLGLLSLNSPQTQISNLLHQG
jgi:hypothetical protein